MKWSCYNVYLSTFKFMYILLLANLDLATICTGARPTDTQNTMYF